MEDETQQQNDPPQGERRSHNGRSREIAWGIVVPTATLVFAMGTWGFGLFLDLVDRISRLDVAVAANSEHRVVHEEQSRHWISQIIRNRDDVRDLEQSVAELRAVPQARPDPFTGTDGDALRARIERLEGDRGEQ